MTLSEVTKLIKHYRFLILYCPAIISAIFLAFGLTHITYYAEARVHAVNPYGQIPMSAMISTAASFFDVNEWSDDGDGSTVTLAESDEGGEGLLLRAEGHNPSACVAAANSAAAYISEQAQTTYDNLNQSGRGAIQSLFLGEKEPAAEGALNELGEGVVLEALKALVEYDTLSECSFSVMQATEATPDYASVIKSTLLFFFAGLFIAFCTVLAKNIAAGLVSNAKEVEEQLKLPILASTSNENAASIAWIKILAVQESVPQSIALISDSVAVGHQFLQSFIESSREITEQSRPNVKPKIECCSYSDTEEALLVAAESEITVLCVHEWHDSVNRLHQITDDLALVKSNIIGIVYFA